MNAGPQAKKLLADEATTPGLRRTMVKTAVIIGFLLQERGDGR